MEIVCHAEFDRLVEMALTEAVCSEIFIEEDYGLFLGFGPCVLPLPEMKPDPDRPGKFLYRSLAESPYLLCSEDSIWQFKLGNGEEVNAADDGAELRISKLVLGRPVVAWEYYQGLTGIAIEFSDSVIACIRARDLPETSQWAIRSGRDLYWTSRSNGELYVEVPNHGEH